MFNRKNIPNLITGGRIVLFLLDLIAINYTYKTHESLHVFFCVLGGIIYALDWMDGFVARKYGWQSKFGAIFDPAGDKICAYSMLAYLYTLGAFPLWALTIILFRDIVLSTIRLASLKYSFNFKTSQMGKLRTNIIGFGGAIIYVLHYWGEFYFIKIKIGVTHVVILMITSLIIFNIAKLPNKYILKLFPRFVDKLGAVVTFVIAAVNPPYSIIFSMIWITLYTLWDYGRAFRYEVNKETNKAHVKKFLLIATIYSIVGICITGLVIGLLKVSLIASITVSNLIFTLLLVGNFNLAKKTKRILRKLASTQTTTSSS